MPALRRQLYNYSKGFVAYHLTTLFRDGDLRALHAIFVRLPVWRTKQHWRWLRRRAAYPLALVWAEILGNFVGPWALWRARRLVRRNRLNTSYEPEIRRQEEHSPTVRSVSSQGKT
jgi:hypothetical protein